MATLKFADTHNMGAFLSKPAESDGFEQIVDFLNAQPIRYALNNSGLLAWSKLSIGKYSYMLYPKTTAWNEFSSIMASDIICLATNQKFNFLKFIFEDEAVHKELGDSLVRAATTSYSLEVEQDSGGGPRCQETMRDTIAQTRFKNVLDLEKIKTTQANEIASLKRMVKKLEKKRSSRTHKLKRLYKVGLSAKVESFGDEESLGEDASKQGRINAIDVDEDISLVNVQDDADKGMYDVGTVTGDEVFAEQEVTAKDVNLT
ncbi:hypothetical protein Tco_1119264, partial [Tanacetum coccineum]